VLRVAARGIASGKSLASLHGSGPYPVMTRAELRAGLDLLPTWALEQKAAANRQVIEVMRRRLAAGEQVARMIRAGTGLAGAPSRGRRGPGRRAPGGGETPPLMWLWSVDGRLVAGVRRLRGFDDVRAGTLRPVRHRGVRWLMQSVARQGWFSCASRVLRWLGGS
jgi:hypothetical protein